MTAADEVTPRLSVVITNYNYEQYVGVAIESALALDWPDVEIVAIDDGSTDNSLTVMKGYADRSQVIGTENGGQRAANNHGFALTTGEVVVFLDADDILPADLARLLFAQWTPTTSKAQFRMQRIDESGTPFGQPFPSWQPVPTPQDIYRWTARTSAYPSPPGSANAYARWFLERIMPVGPEVGEAADSALLAVAPFFGDVVSLPEVVVRYRRHAGNDSDLLADPARFAREVARARARGQFSRLATGETTVDERALRRSRELLQFRVAARRLDRTERPLPGDGPGRMTLDALTAPFQPGPESIVRRLVISAWCLATLALPMSAARRLIVWRYARGNG